MNFLPSNGLWAPNPGPIPTQNLPNNRPTKTAKRKSLTSNPHSLNRQISAQISSEAQLNSAELEQLMRPLPGNLASPFQYQDLPMGSMIGAAAVPLASASTSSSTSSTTAEAVLEKPKFSRPAMRRNKLKREFNPFRERIDYSHVKCPKERRRLRSLDNARLYRDKEKQRIMTLESGIEYFHDHNTRLFENNQRLEKSIALLQKYLAQQAQQVQQVQMPVPAAAPAALPREPTNLHYTPQNGNESEDPNATQNEFSLNNCDLTQEAREATIPDLSAVNESDINAMSEKYRTEIREGNYDQAQRIANIEPLVAIANGAEENCDGKTSSSALGKVAASSSQSSDRSSNRNKHGLSLDLTKLNSTGKSSNGTSSTVRTIVERATLNFEEEEELSQEQRDLEKGANDQEAFAAPNALVHNQTQDNYPDLTSTTIGSIGEPRCHSSMIQPDNLTPISGYGSAEPSPAELLAGKNQKFSTNHFQFGAEVNMHVNY